MKKGLLVAVVAVVSVVFFASVSMAAMDAKSDSLIKKNIKLLNDKKSEHSAIVALASFKESAIPALSETAKNQTAKVSRGS